MKPNEPVKSLGVTFGKRCNFNNGIDLGSEPYLITIGDDSYCSSNVQIITHDGGVNVIRNLYEKYKNIDLFSRVTIGNNVFLGYDVTILPGTVIVGAKSLVNGELKIQQCLCLSSS